MKLTTFLLLISLIQVSAASFGQKVTLKVGETTVNNIFKEIRKQTGYSVMLDKANFKTERKVTANFNNASIQMVMDQVLEGTDFSYVIEDKNIIVEQKEKSSIERIVDRISAIDVSGKVLDTDGKPLPGATVVVKGTKLSTTTQTDGSFSLKGVDEEATLIITYMGFEAREVKAERNLGSIRLSASLNPLDEVQVIAYGTTTRRLSTGNIGTVKAKDIENQPVTNPLLALQGRVPGLVITQQTGVPGGGVVVRVQGQNSMKSGNSPFYVVDGVPIPRYLSNLNASNILGSSGPEYGNGSEDIQNQGNPLNYLNPTDIESIDVLKDADATSIYGSQAANGAILITTKKGKAGSMQLHASINNGWGKAPYNGFEMLNTRQYLDMRYEAFRNDGIDWRSPDVYAPDLKLWDTTRNINWQKELINGTALIQRAQISVSGGSEGTQYRISGTYNKSTSIFPDQGNGNPTASFSASLNSTSSNKRLNIQWITNYQYNHNELPRASFLAAALLLVPNAPNPLNPDGTVNWAPDASGRSTYLSNPYIDILNVYKNTTANLISNLTLSYKILKDMEFKTSLGYTTMLTEDFSPTTTSSIQPENRSSLQNAASYGYRNRRTWLAEPQFNYKTNTSFGSINFLLGSTFNVSNNMSRNVSGINYRSDALLENIASAATLVNIGSVPVTETRYMAYFSRLNYNLNDQLIVNLSARRDGSPNFGENKRFGNFWSVGSAWIFSNQKIVQKLLPWLSFGKLRTSYGVTGNDQIRPFSYISTYSSYFTAQTPYQGITTLQLNGLSNPDLVWERVRKLSAGIDLGLLKDRLTLNVSYSQNTSDNQLMNYPIPWIAGAESLPLNLDATVRNWSWEFSLSTENFRSKDFKWTTNLSITMARNKLVSFPNLQQSSFKDEYIIGQPINLRRVTRFAGLNAATGEYLYLDKNENPTTNPYYLEDQIVRSLDPPFYGGIGNNLSFKNFTFNFFIQFQKQWASSTEYYNGDGVGTPGVVQTSQGNQPVTVLNRWSTQGNRAKVARFSTIPNLSQNIAFSDAWWKDASFARLKNVAITWHLPTNWIKKAGLQSANITASGQNLLTLTKYDGPDPETQTLLALPPLRIFTLGVQFIL